jgi:hypothetical protein
VSLPLLESPQARRDSHQRPRPPGGSGSGLPQSLSSLRPISLPSHLDSRLATPAESTVTSPKDESAPDSVMSSPESAKPYFAPNEDDAMLKLVAAHTPSHRGLWDKDNGKALRMIMSEEGTRGGSTSRIPIDNETASASDEIGERLRSPQLPGPR